MQCVATFSLFPGLSAPSRPSVPHPPPRDIRVESSVVYSVGKPIFTGCRLAVNGGHRALLMTCKTNKQTKKLKKERNEKEVAITTSLLQP